MPWAISALACTLFITWLALVSPSQTVYTISAGIYDTQEAERQACLSEGGRPVLAGKKAPNGDTIGGRIVCRAK